VIRASVPRWDDPPPDDESVPDVVYDPPRPPGAFVVSGPLVGPFNLTPRHLRLRCLTDRGFHSVARARAWAETAYARVVADVTPPGQRSIWCLLVVPR
jgi:hypothetical protein